MLAILFAATSAVCAETPAQLLDANARAVMAGGTRTGTAVLSFTYAGQGMSGTTDTKFDLATGRFVDSYRIGPTRGSNGFDGRQAWQQDLSGGYLPESGGDRRELAVNEAYRDANLWWRTDRGGARIEAVGCGVIRVTPPGGKTFDAWFDPVSHQLARVREAQGFATIDTRFADYVLHAGRMVASTVTVDTDGNAGNRQTMQLTGAAIGPVRPAVAFAMPTVRPADWTLPGGRVTVPMRLLNNHIYVDVRIDGHGPFPFLIDTGGHDIVTPQTLAKLGLSQQGSATAAGAGEKTTSSGYTRVASIDVGGAVVRDQTVLALDFSPADVEGFAVGGMLGVEFINRFIVRIDYGRHEVTLIDPARFTAVERRGAGIAVPFEFYDHMPQVRGRFGDRPARFNIDTGSRSEVTMTAPAVAAGGLRTLYPAGVTVTDGWGVGGPSRSYVVRARTLSLGSVVVARPVAGLSDAQHGAFADPNYEGNIGSGLLKRFVVTFDYGRRTMYLAPNATPDPDIGRFDRTGLWLNLDDDGMKVMDVAAGGPAAAAGIKVGDIVTSLGGVAVAGQQLSEVRRSLKLAPVGVPLEVVYRRDGSMTETKLVPRDLIPD